LAWGLNPHSGPVCNGSVQQGSRPPAPPPLRSGPGEVPTRRRSRRPRTRSAALRKQEDEMIPTIDFATVVMPAIIAALVAGLRDDPGPTDGYAKLSAINSHIVLNTKRIDRVVAVGAPALDNLIHEMRRKEASLDTFARCYSACDQILRKAGLKESVRWHGGHVETDKVSWRIIATSRIDGDSAAFRQEQVEEIIRRAKEVGIALGRKR
jgi:hypothetical protein